jgi:hypothetical protein
MRIRVVCVIALLVISSTAYSAQDAPRKPELKVLRLEHGGTASSYISQHSFKCGDSLFEMTIESPRPVRVTELKVDGKSVSSAQLSEVNASIPELSWFNRITTSCTSKTQSLNLRISTTSDDVTVPLSFEGGLLVKVGARGG